MSFGIEEVLAGAKTFDGFLGGFVGLFTGGNMTGGVGGDLGEADFFFQE